MINILKKKFNMKLLRIILAASAVWFMTGLYCIDNSSNLTAYTSYINEYTHPNVIISAHPTGDDTLTDDWIMTALKKNVHSIELDLRLRQSKVLVNHDEPNSNSPTLQHILDLIIQYKGNSDTVQKDNYQFFIILEPKENDLLLFDKILDILKNTKYSNHFSTNVQNDDRPQGITVVITSDYTKDFHTYLLSKGINKYAIVENISYTGQHGLIINQSPTKEAFQWKAYNFEELDRGQINKDHFSKFNVRLYETKSEENIRIALSTGADSINCDYGKFSFCQTLPYSQKPRGKHPSLYIYSGYKPVVTWRGNNSNNIYTAVGKIDINGGLHFYRQINLSYLLPNPRAIAPSLSISPNGIHTYIYEGTAEHRLWMVSGNFNNYKKFVTFNGQEHRLTFPNDSERLGYDPSVAFDPYGRMIAVYEGTNNKKLWYISGTLDQNGSFQGTEYCLTQGDSRRGSTPSIAFSSSGQVVVVYRGTNNSRLFYVSGHLDGNGKIYGNEYRLTTPDEDRRGSNPSIAIAPNNFVIIVYQGTSENKIWYSYGWLQPDGSITNINENLLTDNTGTVVKGYTPTVAIDSLGHVIILYEGTADGKLWYISGTFSNGKINAPIRLLDMNLMDN